MNIEQVNIHWAGPVWAGDVIVELLKVCYYDGPLVRGRIEQGCNLTDVYIEFGYSTSQELLNHFVGALAKIASIADMRWDITNGNEVNFYLPAQGHAAQPEKGATTLAPPKLMPGIGMPVWLGIETTPGGKVISGPGLPSFMRPQDAQSLHTTSEAVEALNKSMRELLAQLAAAAADIGTAMGKLTAALAAIGEKMSKNKQGEK